MILASFNVENLFARPKVMNLETWKEGADVLAAYSEFNTLVTESVYTPEVKRRLLKLLEKMRLLAMNKAGALRLVKNPKFVVLRKNKGAFLKEPKDVKKPVEIVASGRDSWVGWVELTKESTDEIATRNTAQVIMDVKPDVIGIVEAENRRSLKEFNRVLIKPPAGTPFEHVMLIEGNDPRGIDVGVMARAGYPISIMQSHVDDANADGDLIFSRDCPVYEIRLASGMTLWLLINHLKSRGYRGVRDPDEIRREQAQQVRAIYEQLKATGAEFIAVIGDLNDSPDRGPLDPLLKTGSDLKDVSGHPLYQSDGIPGTHGAGYADAKFDYILLSPKLFLKVKAAGVFRKGVWDKRKKPKWEMYANMKGPQHGASDHALVWAEVDID